MQNEHCYLRFFDLAELQLENHPVGSRHVYCLLRILLFDLFFASYQVIVQNKRQGIDGSAIVAIFDYSKREYPNA